MYASKNSMCVVWGWRRTNFVEKLRWRLSCLAFFMMSSFWQLPTTLCPHSAEPPPAITVEGNVTASPGSLAVLTCHVASTVNFNLTWLRGGHDARLDPRVRVLGNLSLQVSTVTPDNSGWYECIAINEGGVTAKRIYLSVQGEECVWCRLQLI